MRLIEVEVKINDHSFDETGFNNCDPKTNGEYNILDKIIYDSDLVFDIGANCGEWSKRALDKGASVIAFEPVPHEFEELKK